MPKLNNIVTNRGNDGFAAIFRARTDGDWDFVAMVTLEDETFPQVSQTDPLPGRVVLNLIGEGINEEGDCYLIEHFPDPNCPQTYVYPSPHHARRAS